MIENDPPTSFVFFLIYTLIWYEIKVDAVQFVELQGFVKMTYVKNPPDWLTEQDIDLLVGKICWQYVGDPGYTANPSGILRAIDDVLGRFELGINVQVIKADVFTTKVSI